ncbi:alanine racemase [Brachybacterium muris]
MPTGAATGRVAVIERALERAGISQRPVAVLDLDAFDANAADLTSRAHGMPIRVASKSLRVRALIERALGQPGFAGVLAYTLPEALWLASHGIDDIVVAYPTADAQAIAALAADDHARSAITLMVDETAHLDLILTAARGAAGPARSIRVAIELDVS